MKNQIYSEQDKNNINNINVASLKESEVLKSTPSRCITNELTLNAYSSAVDEEKTFGHYILSFLEEEKEKCENCGDIKFNHTSFIYKNNRRIKITIHNLTEQINLIDKVSEFLGFNDDISTISSKKNNKESEEDGIFSYGFCEICNCIVTPLVKLPEEVLNYSGTKFFENILYNTKNLINFGDEKVNILNFDIHQKNFLDADKNEDVAYHCQKLKHLHFKDISRIFVTKIGAVKFRYEDIIKYKILGSLLNINSKNYINYNKENKIKQISMDKVWSYKALEYLQTKLNVHKNVIENLKSENFSELIHRTKKVIDDTIEVAEDLKKKNELIFGDANDYENIFVYNTNLRKYLLKIMNIKMMSNKLLKKITRIMKLIFYEEIYEMNKKAQENKNFELAPKSGQDDGNSSLNLDGKSLSENLKNKDSKEINKEEGKDENNNNNIKSDVNTKGKNISAPLLKSNNDNINYNDNFNDNDTNKLNMSNSSSFSDIEENEDENNENNETIQEEKNIKKNTDLSVIKNKSEKLNISQAGEMNLNNEEKEIKIEENSNSNSKLLDLSLKKSIFNLSFFNTAPELKEQINSKYNMCLNDINKYISNILDIDKNELIQKIITKLNYYDKNHNLYSVEVNDEDICSIISYALTSTQYLNSVKIDNKDGLNDIKSEFINDDDNDLNYEADKELFCSTSLLYDIDKVKFNLGNFTGEKISQTLKYELIGGENNICTYEVKYNPFSTFNEVFRKKPKKGNKSNINSKINYTDIDQKFYSMNSELNNLKHNIIKMFEQKYYEIKKRFIFEKKEIFQEEKLPINEMKVTIYYTKHFESFRILNGASYFDFLHSIMKSKEWSSVTGGKSKAHFFKSWDEKYVVKCLDEREFNMFIDNGRLYFFHFNKYFFFKMYSSLVKVLGAFKIKTKKREIYCVIMENLNYLLKAKNTNIVTYDLKGSERNRYVKNKENNRVLMDTNFIEDFGGEPLALDKEIYDLINFTIKNDIQICRNMGVMDYSLLCIIIDYNEDGDEKETEEEKKTSKMIFNKEDREGKTQFIRLGILDYFRKYTGEKQIETLYKTIINFNTPTVINPKKYDERFFKKLSSYFIGS